MQRQRQVAFVTRVVAGALGGRRLQVPRGRTVRPTSERVREAMFSTLGGRVPGATVLDLFAGSGALGIEALSRGAGHVTFVERDRAVARVLRANLDALGVDADVHTIAVDRFVQELATVPGSPVFDLVLCDPPYAMATAAVVSVLRGLAERGHVASDAMMVVERARHGDPVTVPDDVLAVVDVRTYGDTVLYYVRNGRSVSREGGPGT